MFNVGDEVEFTDECDKGWFFGPHSKYKTGVISSVTPQYYYKYGVKVGGVNGGVNERHITLIPKIIPYTEFQTGDTEEDI